MAAAAKAMISMSRARATASATAARIVPRRFYSTGGEAGGAGAASAAKAARTVPLQIDSSSDGTLLSDTKGKIVHEDRKRSFEMALFDHKVEVKQLVHEQNVRIIKLQHEVDMFKVDIEAMKQVNEMNHEVMKGQSTLLNCVIAVFGGVGLFSTLFN